MMRSVHFKDKILEVSAVIFNLLYTIFYLNDSVWCYLFGIVGPLLFILLCLRKKLYAEPILQMFYIGFALYGYLTVGEEWTTIHWSFYHHLPYLIAGVVVFIIAGYSLRKKTDAKLPYLDSLVTVFGIIGTWMMVNYVHENWLYFIAINAISIFIYFNRQLYLGGIMFIIYFIMACDGYFTLGIFSS